MEDRKYGTPDGIDFLCRNAVSVSYDKLSEENVRIFKDRLLDITGCMLGGSIAKEDAFFTEYFKTIGGLVTKQVKDGRLSSLYHDCSQNLGKVFFTEESFKCYPGGIPTTAAANCGKDIRTQIIKADGLFDARKIRKVHVFRSDKVHYNYYSEPFVLRNHMNALFSYQFSCCCAMYHGSIGVEHVQTDVIERAPELVHLVEESAFDIFADEKPLLKAVVKMADGREFVPVQDYASSMYAYPTREFLENKLRSQFGTCGKFAKLVADNIIEIAGRIEELSDMRGYTEPMMVYG